MNNRDFRVGERLGTRESIAGKLQLEWKKICVVMHGRVTVGSNNIIWISKSWKKIFWLFAAQRNALCLNELVLIVYVLYRRIIIAYICDVGCITKDEPKS